MPEPFFFSLTYEKAYPLQLITQLSKRLTSTLLAPFSVIATAGLEANEESVLVTLNGPFRTSKFKYHERF